MAEIRINVFEPILEMITPVLRKHGYDRSVDGRDLTESEEIYKRQDYYGYNQLERTFIGRSDNIHILLNGTTLTIIRMRITLRGDPASPNQYVAMPTPDWSWETDLNAPDSMNQIVHTLERLPQ